jgi:hypothetical protein
MATLILILPTCRFLERLCAVFESLAGELASQIKGRWFGGGLKGLAPGNFSGPTENCVFIRPERENATPHRASPGRNRRYPGIPSVLSTPIGMYKQS